jgi:hypothetical protein
MVREVTNQGGGINFRTVYIRVLIVVEKLIQLLYLSRTNVGKADG